jgi:hypothetical protein
MTDLAAALADPAHEFTRDEVAELIATAVRWGYEARVDEENATYPPADAELAFNAGEHIRAVARIRYREECDAAVRAEVEEVRALEAMLGEPQ